MNVSNHDATHRSLYARTASSVRLIVAGGKVGDWRVLTSRRGVQVARACDAHRTRLVPWSRDEDRSTVGRTRQSRGT